MFTAAEIAAGVRSGAVSPVAVLEEALRRIEALDGQIEAWVQVDREGALRAARQIETAGRRDGALLGVPVGVKDIIDVAGLETRAGAAAFARRRPQRDATVVRRLREAGAIILGKTATTQFAFQDPATTRNPWNLEHTPGGSSSGSAAAVAASIVPLALGSQTVGSTLRPAAYCGIVGLKATHGRISTAGVFPLAPSLDHVGILCRSVLDAALALDAVAGHDAADPLSAGAAVDGYAVAIRAGGAPPRLGLARRFYRDAASEAVSDHVEAVAARLAAAGATIQEVEMPLDALPLRELAEPILRAEAAAAHRALFLEHANQYGPRIRSLVEAGLATPAVEYIEAQSARRRLREELTGLVDGIDALLLPVAPATAPAGLISTGDPVFCAPASFAGLPAIALPSGLARDGLPLAVQLVAGPFAEAQLLRVAAWVERVLDFKAEPALAAS